MDRSNKKLKTVYESHCDNSSFISMLVYLLFLFFNLFLSLSVSLFVFFFFSIEENNLNMDGISCYITFVFVFAFVWSTYTYYANTSAPVERNFQGYCSRPTLLSNGNKLLRCHSEMVSRVIFQRKPRKQ